MLVLKSGLASQPKSDFTLILNALKIEIILKYTKSHVLKNSTSVTTQGSRCDTKFSIYTILMCQQRINIFLGFTSVDTAALLSNSCSFR